MNASWRSLSRPPPPSPETPPSASSPTKFSHVRDALNSFGDYTEENETLHVISTDPLHLQLSPLMFPGDDPGVVADDVKRAMVYGVYRTFIPTDARRVTVTVIPRLVNNGRTDSRRLVSSYEQRATVTRERAPRR